MCVYFVKNWKSWLYVFLALTIPGYKIRNVSMIFKLITHNILFTLLKSFNELFLYQ